MASASALTSRFLLCISALTSFDDKLWYRRTTKTNPFLSKLLLAIAFLSLETLTNARIAYDILNEKIQAPSKQVLHDITV